MRVVVVVVVVLTLVHRYKAVRACISAWGMSS